jgi:hypothetical protein
LFSWGGNFGKPTSLFPRETSWQNLRSQTQMGSLKPLYQSAFSSVFLLVWMCVCLSECQCVWVSVGVCCVHVWGFHVQRGYYWRFDFSHVVKTPFYLVSPHWMGRIMIVSIFCGNRVDRLNGRFTIIQRSKEIAKKVCSVWYFSNVVVYVFKKIIKFKT